MSIQRLGADGIIARSIQDATPRIARRNRPIATATLSHEIDDTLRTDRHAMRRMRKQRTAGAKQKRPGDIAGGFTPGNTAALGQGRTALLHVPVIQSGSRLDIERSVGGTDLHFKCTPVNRLASDVAAKTIEDAIEFLKTSSPKASFEQRKDFALSMHSVEVGRRCTLRQSGAATATATATLDIRFPE